MDISNCKHLAASDEKLLGLHSGVRGRYPLCSSCSSIDFNAAFALSSTEVGRYGRALTMTRTDISVGCDLCSLVPSMTLSKSVPTSKSVGNLEVGYHLRAFDSLWALSIRRTGSRVAKSPSIVVAVVEETSRQSLRVRLKEAFSRGFVVPLVQGSSWETSKIDPFYYRARTVSHTEVDFTLVSSWLRECQEAQLHSHHRCKSQPRRTTFSSRVIDCETREILPLTSDLEYLALSYVWGNNVKAAEDDQTVLSNPCLPKPAPRTIEDAMTVVRSLQKRYLWVDRYCIWDSENKHVQIQNMDQVYHNALTTIVAAVGDNAESGLIGVSCPRQQQIVFRTNAGTLAYTFPHVSYHLLTSTWVTRGWTYQEAILSRSCLFFTKDQVYFAFKTHLRSEAVGQKQFAYHDKTQEVLALGLMRVTDYTNRIITQSGQPFFYDHIKEYTSRSLR